MSNASDKALMASSASCILSRCLLFTKGHIEVEYFGHAVVKAFFSFLGQRAELNDAQPAHILVVTTVTGVFDLDMGNSTLL